MRFCVRDLGVLPYSDALAIQTDLLEGVAAGTQTSTLLLLEHRPVITLGSAHQPEHLLLAPHEYEARGIEIHPSSRGGDVTYHGPGQLVAYPIFNLGHIEKDVRRWLRDLEQAIILALSDFGIEGRRFAPHTGVWVGDRKVAAIGVKIRKWVSMHGVAINCDNDLSPFGLIVPCGISGFGVTSITQEVGARVTVEETKSRLSDAFVEVFG